MVILARNSITVLFAKWRFCVRRPTCLLTEIYCKGELSFLSHFLTCSRVDSEYLFLFHELQPIPVVIDSAAQLGLGLAARPLEFFEPL